MCHLKAKCSKKKKIKPISCKCKFKCSEHLNEDDQSLIYTIIGREVMQKQRNYIKENVIKTDKRRKTTITESRRKNTLQYFFTDQGGSRVQLCKTTFLCTLGIGENPVQYTLGRQGNNSMTDRRGRKKGYSKFSQEDKEYICEHIHSFPTVSSHYCRKNTQRKYLSKDLSIAKMYFIRKNVQKMAENQRRFGCIIKSLVRNIILASISPRKISAPFVKLTNCNQNQKRRHQLKSTRNT